MSLYNMVNGVNPNAKICLGMLAIKAADIPRIRDSWLSDDGKFITILARIGGANREHYIHEIERITETSGYVQDRDDEFDSTFAHFIFGVPEKFLADTALIANVMVLVGQGEEACGPGSLAKSIKGELPMPAIAKEDIPNDPRVLEGYEAYKRIAMALNAIQAASRPVVELEGTYTTVVN